MRPNRIRTPFAALLAATLVLITLTACHDEIPSQRDNLAVAPAADTSADPAPTPISAQAAPVTIQHRKQAAILSYGASEHARLPRATYVTYSVSRGGVLWDGVSLLVSCTGLRSLSINNLRPRSDDAQATLLVVLDDHPAQVVDVFLRRYQSYSPDGQGEIVSFQLDDAVWYERLRSAEKLTIRLLDSDQDPVTFDLTRLFSTVFQDEIDNCAESETTSRAGYQRVSVAPSR